MDGVYFSGCGSTLPHQFPIDLIRLRDVPLDDFRLRRDFGFEGFVYGGQFGVLGSVDNGLPAF